MREMGGHVRDPGCLFAGSVFPLNRCRALISLQQWSLPRLQLNMSNVMRSSSDDAASPYARRSQLLSQVLNAVASMRAARLDDALRQHGPAAHPAGAPGVVPGHEIYPSAARRPRHHCTRPLVDVRPKHSRRAEQGVRDAGAKPACFSSLANRTSAKCGPLPA